jgi:hypothetical protein
MALLVINGLPVYAMIWMGLDFKEAWAAISPVDVALAMYYFREREKETGNGKNGTPPAANGQVGSAAVGLLLLLAVLIGGGGLLAGCATVDVGGTQLTFEQRMYVAHEQLGRTAYSIERAHGNGVLSEGKYRQATGYWGTAATLYNGLVAGTNPPGDLDRVDAALASIQDILLEQTRKEKSQ